jgi:hypothetical protein
MNRSWSRVGVNGLVQENVDDFVLSVDGSIVNGTPISAGKLVWIDASVQQVANDVGMTELAGRVNWSEHGFILNGKKS